jgi:hypothetical protein
MQDWNGVGKTDKGLMATLTIKPILDQPMRLLPCSICRRVCIADLVAEATYTAVRFAVHLMTDHFLRCPCSPGHQTCTNRAVHGMPDCAM